MGPFLKIRGAFPFPPHPPSHDEHFFARDERQDEGPFRQPIEAFPFPPEPPPAPPPPRARVTALTWVSTSMQ